MEWGGVLGPRAAEAGLGFVSLFFSVFFLIFFPLPGLGTS